MEVKHKIVISIYTLAAVGSILLGASNHLNTFLNEIILSQTPQIIFFAVVAVIGASLYAHRAGLFKSKKIKAVVGCLVLVSIVANIYNIYGVAVSQPTQGTTNIVSQKTKTIRFATFNKHYANKQYSLIASYIKQNNIDVIAFQEITPDELSIISDLTGYQYTRLSPKDSAASDTRAGILSRLPISKGMSKKLSEGYALIRIEVKVNDKMYAFYSLHNAPPFTNKKYIDGKESLAAISRMIKDDRLPSIVSGDFNTTTYSPKLASFDHETAKVIKPIIFDTLPECSWYGYGGIFCMRIDHVYIPTSAQLHSTWISPYLGSDHRMVIADMSL